MGATPSSSARDHPPDGDLVGPRDHGPRGRPALPFTPPSRAIHDPSTGRNIEYQSCLEVEQVDLEIFRHLCEEIRLDGSRNRLFHSFRSSNRLAPAPISHVLLTSRVSDLSIQSFPHISRRVRDRPHPVVVRGEGACLEMLKIRGPQRRISRETPSGCCGAWRIHGIVRANFPSKRNDARPAQLRWRVDARNSDL